MADNNIGSDKYRLIQAAASDNCGKCWFYIGKPASWYGQSIVSDEEITSHSDIFLKIKDFLKIKSLQNFNNEMIQRVPCVELKEIIRNQDRVDYMMLDIQGSEEVFLTKYPEILHKHIKMINVGTHSNTIEKNLRSFFSDLGWTCTFDIPMNSTVRFNISNDQNSGSKPKIKDITFGDGVQIWHNNAL